MKNNERRPGRDGIAGARQTSKKSEHKVEQALLRIGNVMPIVNVRVRATVLLNGLARIRSVGVLQRSCDGK